MDADGDARTLRVRITIERGSRNAPAERIAGFSLDVAFDAPEGVTVLRGPSGSGKSTVLAAIAGLLRPTCGVITLGGETWCNAEEGIHVPSHKRGVAVVFQSLALFPHMTAAENVVYGMPRGTRGTARADALLARLHVAHLSTRKPPTFSGGEAQRVAIARALAMSPRAILLDEPFSALDPELKRGLVADVRDLVCELRVPVVLVTHQHDEAIELGRRIVSLERGQIQSANVDGPLTGTRDG